MADYTIKVRRFKPESGDGPYWEDFDVELEESLSVLDALLQARSDQDGSLAVRCSCRAAICGSCGVKVNGQSTLACKTKIQDAQNEADRAAGLTPTEAVEERRDHARAANRVGSGRIPASPGSPLADARLEQPTRPIVIEPMGNMPVIKDLVTDMESTHWTKVRRVTPWLIPDGPPPEREYVVPQESMIDVTQSMACIQCGACVSACLSMEVDPDFIGPAALAKAYRFVGDPRDSQRRERLYDLAQDPHGIYDCTHCFSCIDACPKGVAPMDQIMRLRRLAGDAEGIDDVNNGRRHERAFTKIIEKKGTLDESLLLQESFAEGVKGKLKPSKGAMSGLIGSIPTALRGIRTGKMRSLSKLIPGVHAKLPGDAQDQVKRIYEHAEEHGEEFNLYISGEEAEEEMAERDIPAGGEEEKVEEVVADPAAPGRDSGGGDGQ